MSGSEAWTDGVAVGDGENAAGDGEGVTEPEGLGLVELVCDALGDAYGDVGLGLAGGTMSGSSSVKMRVRFSGVASARTANWPFWIPGRMTSRSMSAGSLRVNVRVLPAPQLGPGADAQKLVTSSPVREVAG